MLLSGRGGRVCGRGRCARVQLRPSSADGSDATYRLLAGGDPLSTSDPLDWCADPATALVGHLASAMGLGPAEIEIHSESPRGGGLGRVEAGHGGDGEGGERDRGRGEATGIGRDGRFLVRCEVAMAEHRRLRRAGGAAGEEHDGEVVVSGSRRCDGGTIGEGVDTDHGRTGG